MLLVISSKFWRSNTQFDTASCVDSLQGLDGIHSFAREYISSATLVPTLCPVFFEIFSTSFIKEDFDLDKTKLGW